MLIKYNFQIFYIKKLENKRANILNKKPKYYKNKKYISHTILTIEELKLKYNKSQLTITVRLKTDN